MITTILGRDGGMKELPPLYVIELETLWDNKDYPEFRHLHVFRDKEQARGFVTSRLLHKEQNPNSQYFIHSESVILKRFKCHEKSELYNHPKIRTIFNRKEEDYSRYTILNKLYGTDKLGDLFYVMELKQYTEGYSSNYARVQLYKMYTFTDERQAQGFMNEGNEYGGYHNTSYFTSTIEQLLEYTGALDLDDLQSYPEFLGIEDMRHVDYSEFLFDGDEEEDHDN